MEVNVWATAFRSQPGFLAWRRWGTFGAVLTADLFFLFATAHLRVGRSRSCHCIVTGFGWLFQVAKPVPDESKREETIRTTLRAEAGRAGRAGWAVPAALNLTDS
jgi:hypothetical protein